MAQTLIEWTHRRHPQTQVLHPGYTFNPVIGCAKVSPACRLCYAASMDARRFSKTLGGATSAAPISHWGKGAPRYRTSAETWKNPLKWNRMAEKAGMALAVFCGSLCDWADEELPDSLRDDLMELVLKTPSLEWLFLTKRPANARRYFSDKTVPPNVRMGATMENQEWFDLRIGDLLAIDAPLGHFASMEPLLGPVDITAGLDNPLVALFHGREKPSGDCGCCTRGLGWVIVGGESNHGDKTISAPTHPDDVLAIAANCWSFGIPFTFKQWGDWVPAYELADPQAQAMCALGKVAFVDRGRGDKGRRLAFNVGKPAAGRLFEGKIWDQHPPARLLS